MQRAVNSRARGKVPFKNALARRIVDAKCASLDAANAELLKRQCGIVRRRRRDRHPGAGGVKALETDKLRNRVQYVASREKLLTTQPLLESAEVKDHVSCPGSQIRRPKVARRAGLMRDTEGEAETQR